MKHLTFSTFDYFNFFHAIFWFSWNLIFVNFFAHNFYFGKIWLMRHLIFMILFMQYFDSHEIWFSQIYPQTILFFVAFVFSEFLRNLIIVKFHCDKVTLYDINLIFGIHPFQYSFHHFRCIRLYNVAQSSKI